MARLDQSHVRLDGGVIVWDGVTQPETQAQGKNAGKPKWTLKVVFPPHCNDLNDFDQLAGETLQQSQFKGVLPQGGRMPIGQVQPGEFGDMFPGWLVISFKTTLRAPDVYDDNNVLMDPMQYTPFLYSGQKVNVMAHCYEYNNAGNKGISAGMDAIQIMTQSGAQRLNFGNGPNTASAFGQQQPQGNQGGYGGYGGQQQPQGNQGGYGGQQQPQGNQGGYGGQQQPQGNQGGYGGQQQPQGNQGGYGGQQQPQGNQGGYGGQQQPQGNQGGYGGQQQPQGNQGGYGGQQQPQGNQGGYGGQQQPQGNQGGYGGQQQPQGNQGGYGQSTDFLPGGN